MLEQEKPKENSGDELWLKSSLTLLGLEKIRRKLGLKFLNKLRVCTLGYRWMFTSPL